MYFHRQDLKSASLSTHNIAAEKQELMRFTAKSMKYQSHRGRNNTARELFPRSWELGLSLVGCSTQESGLCTSSKQHSRAGPGGQGVNELTLRT